MFACRGSGLQTIKRSCDYDPLLAGQIGMQGAQSLEGLALFAPVAGENVALHFEAEVNGQAGGVDLGVDRQAAAVA
jgi:hypothetical protein